VPEPDVIVSIVNHLNYERTLACLESLVDDPGRASSIEIVVLDNASGNGSVEKIRAEYPDVTVIQQGFRAGFGANHNTVIGSTSSQYILVLNDDTVVPPGTLDALKSFLDARPEAAIVGPRIFYEDGSACDSAWRFPTPKTCAVSALSLGQVGVIQSRTETPRRVDWLGGAAFMIRRSVLEEIGGAFDETFFMYMEETDLCRRIWNSGNEVWYTPLAKVIHAGWGSTEGLDERRVNELWRSRRYYWSKHETPTGARIAETFDWIRYSLGSRVASVLARLPESMRPDGVGEDLRRRLRLNARVIREGSTGPGLRELAEDANRQAGVAATPGRV
jgi:N-acetylglucosaminyl-diphospho-decaprenol L-rhamnosyltransferase